MHTLWLMRHAKAVDWSGRGDHGRGLSDTGRRDAAEAGRELRSPGPDRALVSSAARTRETFEQLGLACPAEVLDDLYNCGTATLLQLVAESEEGVGRLVVVGHSPAVPALAAELAGPTDEDLAWFPTSAFAELEVDGTWAGLADGTSSARLVRVRRRD